MPYIPDPPDQRVGAPAPDYPLAEGVRVDTPAKMKAIADPTRHAIVDLLLERAATTSELAVALQRPKGTIDHHLKVLANAGLVQVVRTRKVRAMTERYWGRVARTIYFEDSNGGQSAVLMFVREAHDEIERATMASDDGGFSTLRHARIPIDRAEEFSRRLDALALEFTECPRDGDTVYGLLIALYATDKASLPAPPADGDAS